MANFFQKLFPAGNFRIFNKNRSVIGIDFGSSSIKVIQLKNNQGRAVLETYGELSTGPYGGLAIGQAVNLSTDKLSSLLKDLFIEANITNKEGALAIPLRSSLLVSIELPDVPGLNLEEAVPIEARKYVPVPISEVALDWWVMPKTDQSANDRLPHQSENQKNESQSLPMIEVFLVAIHKDTLKQYEAVSKLAAFNPRFFEIETFSVMRSVLEDNRGVVAIVDIGSATTKMVIVDNGAVKLSHTINKGSQDLTLAIARSMNIPFDKAEEIKRRVGLVEKIGATDMAKTINPTVEYVFSEVSQVMLDYQKRRNRSIDRVILIGGGALLKGIMETAAQNIYAPVELGLPFNRVEAPAFLDNVLKEIGPSFAVAIGLALRALEEG